MSFKFVNRVIVLTLFVILMLNPSWVLADGDLSDDFNNNRIDLANWIKFEIGGPTVNEVNGQLEITIPANSYDPNFFGAGYASACVLTGDFDIQVDYQLLKWPSQNGVRVSIYTGPNNWDEVSRLSWGAFEDSSSFDPNMPEVYITFLNRATISTNDMLGKLRLTRIDGISTGYYFDSALNNWIAINSGPYTNDNVHMYLGAYTSNFSSLGKIFGEQEVKVAFDNVIVEGRQICKGRFSPGHPGIFL